MSQNIIELRNIKKVFEDDDTTVVENFNLEVKKGEFVTFLGPSGCGKTTTLRMIAGFEFPTEGEILLNGEDISHLPPNLRPINTVFQRYALFPHLNVYENVAFGLNLKKLPKHVIDEKVKKVLEVVDLEGFEKRKISTLSGGQQQRIAIARAIVNEPDILLLDEPLGALDLKMRKEMQIELKAMHEQLGITFIYVTHDQEEALTMSDKVVVMSDGMIQQIGTPEEIYNEPKNAFVADFIGESNIFEGRMTASKTVAFCGAQFPCVDNVPKDTRVDVVVRPEDVVITSVVPQVMYSMKNAFRKYLGKEPLVVQENLEIPIVNRYSNPAEVGADRLVNSFAALRKYGAPLIVVDFGTATTFDVIDPSGAYLGGSIYPGIKVSLDALVGNTSKLPRVEIEPPAKVVGDNTVSSIQSGIVYGYCGAVIHMLKLIRQELGVEAKAVATGGLSGMIGRQTGAFAAIDKSLTLDGLELIYREGHRHGC